MARLILAAALFAVTTGTARADDDFDPEIVSIAAEAGVEPILLAGAIATTGLPARTYLEAVGELEPPQPPLGVWDRLAMCESHGNWATNTGNGFFGGTQTLLSTWRAYGGLQYASRPDLATRAQQIAVNERILVGQGWRAWPACSLRMGLR